MKIYIVASNKYTHTCPVNVHFLNKHWPGQDIVILGYENTQNLKDLPSNVKVEYLGPQESFGNSWTSGLIPFFEKNKDEYFTILVEDFVLLNAVDKEKMDLLENCLIHHGADKAVIGGGLPLSQSTVFRPGVILFNQHIPYRATLHPSIWKRDYFLRYLKPGLTPWQFEVNNNQEASQDGANIIALDYRYPEQKHIFSALNVYSKGKLTLDPDGNVLDNQPSQRFWSKADLQFVWEEVQKSKKELGEEL